ncbi:hypothetical protein [Thermincola potens]|uniref:Uncharacterized protein n=1 Tax=Thermincola potens (strain JR) TaxID=635013 RepID=D5XAI5_THEPJ|nr:hypothetical protein [Thermincola potens]ADG81284.1 hypothetical protein TherJR_0398 [Thermincola potens JR]
MGKSGLMTITILIGMAFILIGSWIGNPIRPIHYVLVVGALLCGFISLVLFFGSLQKTEEKIYMAIVIILTILIVFIKDYLF